jgi:hypothetical protein
MSSWRSGLRRRRHRRLNSSSRSKAHRSSSGCTQR